MIQFKVSAPGTLSLFGELVDRYARSSLIASINLRTTLTFTELSEHVIQLKFPQINLTLSVPLKQFEEFYQHCESNMKLLFVHVQQFVACNPQFCSTQKVKTFIQIFFYLLVDMIHNEKIKITPFCVELSTQLTVDIDVVCLVPSTVCFAASFLHWSHLQNDINRTLNSDDLKSIRLYALKCEEISRNIELAGVTVCTYGSVVHHQIINSNRTINWFFTPNVPILLIDSQQTPSLNIQLQRLRDLINNHPDAAFAIFDKIEYATQMASSAFRSLAAVFRNGEVNLRRERLDMLLQNHVLMSAIDMNQRLLQLLNMSHYHLDEICYTARKHGMYGKYTNIGNGRCAYIWCHLHVSRNRIMLLSQDLTAQRFVVIRTCLDSCGVKIE